MKCNKTENYCEHAVIGSTGTHCYTSYNNGYGVTPCGKLVKDLPVLELIDPTAPLGHGWKKKEKFE